VAFDKNWSEKNLEKRRNLSIYARKKSIKYAGWLKKAGKKC